MPRTPRLNIIKPPRNQILTIRDAQPLAESPFRDHAISKKNITNVAAVKIENPTPNMSFKGVDENEVTASINKDSFFDKV